MGQALGFDEEKRSNIGIVATELANNIVAHAQSGEVLLCPTRDSEGARLDLLALDSGPGIRDIGRAMSDGYSSVGTAGQGLGAIKRISDSSALYSAHGQGTVSWSRFQHGGSPRANVVNVPVAEESVAGDSYLIAGDDERTVYMMVDGLGHGPGAAEAANAAVKTVEANLSEPVNELLVRAHDALRSTRGAAMSVAIAHRDQRTLTYGGVGNISASLIGPKGSRSLVSQNGTVGAVMPRRVQEFSYSFDPETTLVMFSDGLTSRASPAGYLGHQSRPTMLLAGLMYRDFTRRRDDASVLVARLGGEAS